MNIPLTPDLMIGLISLITAGVSHYRLSRIPEKILADAKIAAAMILAEAVVAQAKLKADAKTEAENIR
jgi:hypothetical protein